MFLEVLPFVGIEQLTMQHAWRTSDIFIHCESTDSSFCRCFCGTNSDKYDEYGPAICTMPCSGDADLICGGRRAMHVFSI